MKILVVRFSSIGDIVLTTAVLRCIKQQLPGAELHYLTKQQFSSILQSNPYIDKVHQIKDDVKEIAEGLKKEKFDYLIDLHHNLRTWQLKRALNTTSSSFNKLNVAKFLKVYFKIDRLPKVHIVDRYFEAVKCLGVKNDLKGLDYFIPDKDSVNVNELYDITVNGYYALVAGGSYFTKQIPLTKLREICTLSDKPLLVLGSAEDAAVAQVLEQEFKGKVVNTCGKFNLNQSASIVQQSLKVITSDTGLMHIAAAFKKDIVSLWGNTIPAFGMYAYMPGSKSKILEVENLSCRPCSKLGYKKCPKGHFNCMNKIDVTKIFQEKR